MPFIWGLSPGESSIMPCNCLVPVFKDAYSYCTGTFRVREKIIVPLELSMNLRTKWRQEERRASQLCRGGKSPAESLTPFP